MAAKKKKEPDDTKADGTRSLRADAEEQLARAQESSPDLAGQAPEALIHELQVHQIELEMQAEELRKSKIALEESRDTYLDLYEFAPVGYLMLTEKGIITNVNLTGAMLLGVERNSLVRARFSKFIAEKDSNQWYQYFATVCKQDTKQTCTLTLKRGDGSVFPARLESIRLTGSDGSAPVRVSISDISDIRRAEEEILFKNVILSTQQETSQDGTLVVDENGKILSFNRHFIELWGIPENVIALESDKRTLQSVLDKLADPDAFVARVTYLYTHKDEKSREEIKLKDGRIFDRYSAPMFGQDRKYYGRVWYFRDITERKRAEAALIQSEQFLDNIVEQIPDMIFVKEAEGLRFVRLNKAGEKLLGYSRQEMLGKNDYDFFLKPEADFFTGKDRDVLRTKQVTDIAEEKIQTRNMGERILHTKKIPLVDEEGKPKYLLGISEDITERKQAQDTIALTTRKLSLMNDVTYQFIQNKITGLRGYAELSKDAKTDAERLSFIEKEDHVLADIHHLIKDTREYQEIGSFLPQWIPVEQSIRIARSLISPGEGISIASALSGLELYSDPLLEKIFVNLIENAQKHGKTVTRITFSCKETPDGLVLICEDDGVGISPKVKARLFERSVGQNIRFGLFFVHECLLLSGMTIAETGEPGKGARFEITVPKGMYRFADAGKK